jgi:hypothetical protein
MTHEQKLASAIAYLRSKGKYLIDATCTFKPTRAAEFKPVILRGK